MNSSVSRSFIVLILCLLWPIPSLAIVFNPTDEQINEAIERGKQIAESERNSEEGNREEFYRFRDTYQFGTGGSCSTGNISTKLGSLTLVSYDRAKKYKEVEPDTIKLVRELPDILITTDTCYSNPAYIEQDHLVIKTGDRIIQPARLRQVAVRSGGVYVNQIYANFSLSTFNNLDQITVIVVPPIGEELSFEIDLTSMP